MRKNAYPRFRPAPRVFFTVILAFLLSAATWSFGSHAGEGSAVFAAGILGSSFLRRRSRESAGEKGNEDYLEQVFNSMGFGLLTIDRNYHIVKANAAFLSMVDLRVESDAVGKPCYAVSHGLETQCSAEGIDCPVKRVFETGRTANAVHRHVSWLGRAYDVEISAFPVKEASGRTLHALEVVKDLSIQRRIEERLRESERKFRFLFQKAGEGILIHDLEGNIIDANPKALEMLGYSKEESRDLNLRDLHPPDEREQAEQALATVRVKGMMNYEATFRRKDETLFPGEVSSSTFDIDGKRIIQKVFRDTTERKERERREREHAVQLERSNQLKDLFTDILSHDLLNPASVVQHVSNLLAERDHPRDAKEVEMIRRNAGRIMELIHDASTYARIEGVGALKKVETDIAELLRQRIAGLAPAMEEKKIECTFAPSEAAPAEANRFVGQVFENLISNAVKFSPEASEIEVSLVDEGNTWLVAVADRGEGVEDTFKRSIFDRFQRREKRGVKGTGIGLAIAKKIVEMHGGKIWVEDNPGGGARFCVRLPKSQAGVRGTP